MNEKQRAARDLLQQTDATLPKLDFGLRIVTMLELFALIITHQDRTREQLAEARATHLETYWRKRYNEAHIEEQPRIDFRAPHRRMLSKRELANEKRNSAPESKRVPRNPGRNVEERIR